jgi:Ca2+-transporting ATPase
MNSSNTWHLLLRDEVLQILETDMYRGLTSEEAAARKKHVRGEVWHVRRTSAGEAAAASLFDLPTLILVVAAAAAALFDHRFEAGAIAVTLALGALIRTAVYVRANRILENAARSRIPVGTVIRDGRILLLPAYEIVPGDIIFLEPGDTVPCDGRVISGDDSVVSERGITENRLPVHKFYTVISTEADSGEIPCEFRSNMLFAGSLVLEGSVRIAATACGEDTLISMKQGGVTLDAERDFPLVSRLKKQSRAVSLIMLAAVMLLTGISVVSGNGMALPDVFLGSMAMAVASMSEFISTVAAIIIAVTVQRCASPEKNRGEGKGRILFRDPSRIEDVASPGAIVFCGSGFFKSGHAELLAYRTQGVFTGADRKGPDPADLVALALAASSQSPDHTGISDGVPKTGSEKKKIPHRSSQRAVLTSLAADAYVKRMGAPLPYTYAVGDHRDSSDPMAVGLEISLCERDGVVWAAACGSVRDVLRCCSAQETAEGPAELDDESVGTILGEAAELESSGARVLAVSKRISPYPRLNRLAVLTQSMIFVGFFAVSMEPEENARGNIDYLRRSGIRPILFSETPDEDRYYAARLGLFDGSPEVIPAAEWDAVRAKAVLSDRNHPDRGVVVAFDEIGDAYLGSAYARAMLSLTGSRRNGERDTEGAVAAVGMSAWDAGALGRADIGLAAAGSRFRAVPESIARNAAVIVCPDTERTESGFGGLAGTTGAVRAARYAVTNISRARFYLTAAQTARLVLMLTAVLGIVPLPSPVFILAWGLFFDFNAVLVRAFDRSDETPAMGSDKAGIVTAALTGAAWGIVLSGGVLLASLLVRLLGAWIFARSVSFSVLPDNTAMLRTFLSASSVLTGLVFSAECSTRKSIFARRKPQFNAAQTVFASVSLFAVLWILFAGSGAAFVGGAPCGAAGLLSAVPALLLLAVTEILKLFAPEVRERKKRR